MSTKSKQRSKQQKPTRERRAEIVSSIGQQGISRAEKLVAAFMRDYLDLDPDAIIPPEHWDENPRAQQYAKGLTRGPKKDPHRILEKATDGKIEKNGDNTRLTSVFNSGSTIHKLRRLLPRFDQKETALTREWAKKGFVVTEYEDNFYKSKKYGYRGFDIKGDLLINKGRWARVEIKFLHEHMRETDRYTRALFTERRTIIDVAEAEVRPLTVEEQRIVDSNTEMIHRAYDLDIKNPKYKLDGLEGPTEEVSHFEEKLEQAKQTRGNRRLNTDRDYPINVPWHWEREHSHE